MYSNERRAYYPVRVKRRPRAWFPEGAVRATAATEAFAASLRGVDVPRQMTSSPTRRYPALLRGKRFITSRRRPRRRVKYFRGKTQTSEFGFYNSFSTVARNVNSNVIGSRSERRISLFRFRSKRSLSTDSSRRQSFYNGVFTNLFLGGGVS